MSVTWNKGVSDYRKSKALGDNVHASRALRASARFTLNELTQQIGRDSLNFSQDIRKSIRQQNVKSSSALTEQLLERLEQLEELVQEKDEDLRLAAEIGQQLVVSLQQTDEELDATKANMRTMELEFNTQIQSFIAQATEFKSDLQLLRSEKANLLEVVDDLREVNSGYEEDLSKLRQERRLQMSQLGELQRYKAKAEKYDELNQEYSQLQDVLVEMDEEIQKYKLWEEKWLEIKEQYDEEISTLREQLSNQERSQKYLQVEVNRFRSDAGDNEQSLAHQRAAVDGLEHDNLEGRLGAMEQLLDALNVARDKDAQRIRTLEEELSAFDKERSDLAAQILTSNNSLSQAKLEAQRRETQLLAETQAHKREADKLKSDLAELRLKDDKEAEELRTLVEQLKEEVRVNSEAKQALERELERLNRKLYEEGKAREAAELLVAQLRQTVDMLTSAVPAESSSELVLVRVSQEGGNDQSPSALPPVSEEGEAPHPAPEDEALVASHATSGADKPEQELVSSQQQWDVKRKSAALTASAAGLNGGGMAGKLVAALTEDLAAAKSRVDHLTSDLERLQAENDALKEKLTQTREDEQGEIDRLRDQLAAAEQRALDAVMGLKAAGKGPEEFEKFQIIQIEAARQETAKVMDELRVTEQEMSALKARQSRAAKKRETRAVSTDDTNAIRAMAQTVEEYKKQIVMLNDEIRELRAAQARSQETVDRSELQEALELCASVEATNNQLHEQLLEYRRVALHNAHSGASELVLKVDALSAEKQQVQQQVVELETTLQEQHVVLQQTQRTVEELRQDVSTTSQAGGTVALQTQVQTEQTD
eukprot:c18577_g1_i2.p1 GENE.c18577_g1_i2~~c18577_g1_i2.p1  ORF type:complete len:905 (+),score=259.47 c18577_g1_i2:242-2716(+)